MVEVCVDFVQIVVINTCPTVLKNVRQRFELFLVYLFSPLVP